ncbi:MAG: LptF/LptG family permease [Flavobacteriales bacterium]
MLKKLDWYIIKKLFGTFFFTIFFLILIVVLIDLNQRQERLEMNGGTSLDYLKNYSLYYIVFLANNFVQIVVFISVILFTSKITSNTEIVAMQSSGINFHRIARPYFISGIFIGLIALGINHYILPYSNVKKNEFHSKYLISYHDKMDQNRSKKITAFITPKEQLNILSYNKNSQKGNGFSYFTFNDSLSRDYALTAKQVEWNADSSVYILRNAYEKFGNINQVDSIKSNKIHEYDDSVVYHGKFKIKLEANPDFLLPENDIAENLTTPELLKFIERKKIEGAGYTNTYYTTLYQRTSLPFSTFILTILGLSISSKKRRGGIGFSLVMGLLIAFSYVFFNFSVGILSSNESLDPMVAAIAPNIIFGLLTIFLYFKRALF